MEKELSNYIKYCLGYVKLTRERTVAAQQKDSANILKKYFGLDGLLNGDTDGNLGELINLDTFYSYDPKKVPEEKKDDYNKEKELANKLEGIYNKYQNDPFTKQIIFSFGYFEIELPLAAESDADDEATLLRHAQGDVDAAEIKEMISFMDTNYVGKPVTVNGESGKIAGRSFGKVKVEFSNGTIKAVEKSTVVAAKATADDVRAYLKEQALEKIREKEEAENEEEDKKVKTKIDRYPLFSLPVRIEKDINKAGVGKYSVYAVDPEVQVNIGMLESILGEGLYFQLLKEVGQYEIDEKLALPIIDLEVFKEIWHKIKAQLRLIEVNFDEDSFSLDEIKIALSPRVNYFLAEDLARLAQFPEETLSNTALTSWTVDDDLTLEGDAPHEKELYFPFLYDKYQLSTLSVLGNKASIIQGPPGTGKSETIANILSHLAATGKRVLFVSQKAQALKVVKDKLKKLDVKYLFGYIPNPNSAQIGEEDEIDGVAPQLSALGSYIQKLDQMHGGGTVSPLAPIVEGKLDLQNKISTNIEKQRKFYALHQELLSLKDFDFEVDDLGCFADKFSEEDWQTIKQLKKDIVEAKSYLKKYEKENPETKGGISYEDLKAFRGEKYSPVLQSIKKAFLEIWTKAETLQKEIGQLTEDVETYETKDEKVGFDKRFIILNPKEADFTECLAILKKDIENTAYDRHFKLLRKVNNIRRNMRLSDTLQKLPREVVDCINQYLDQDVSRTEAKKFTASLYDYFNHYAKIRDLAKKRSELMQLLNGFIAEHDKEISVEIAQTLRGAVCREDVSRPEVETFLTGLINYFGYFEQLKEIISAKEQLENECESNLKQCGISHDDYSVIEKLIEGKNLASAEDLKKEVLRVQEIKTELRALSKTESVNTLSSQVKRADIERTKRIAGYLQNIVNQNIIRKWKGGITIKQIVQKLAKAFGKSKKAFKTFDNLRKDTNNFNAILDLIPIWIMELDDASRIIPLEPGLFDYVILDEASQCNVAYTLPVMFRSKRALFVGDSEQMRDSTIMFKSNKHFESLARMYQIPVERQIKAFGDTVQSVLNIAENRGFMAKTLHYHYRSPRELIGFSNEYFYKPNGKDLIPLNSNYLAYGDTNRVMLVHEVEPGNEEFSDKVNVAEGKAILELFEELHSDEKYNGKSIGILTFFNHQATFLRDLFEKAGYKEERDNYKISIIEGIQGDEKDIVIYSLVIRSPDQKNKYTSLTGEGGDIQAAVNKGRVNVAFSRAKLQVHCFVSMPPQEMPDKIWLKKYLEYIKENGEVDFYATDLKPFDSYFEEEFYNLMRAKLKKGYTIQNQVASCGFKLDFVISNASTGKKIAIECDGPTHFKDEIDEAYGIHIQSDEERQRVLEAAGWRFCRIKYMDWINEDFDRDTVVETVVDLLT